MEDALVVSNDVDRKMLVLTLLRNAKRSKSIRVCSMFFNHCQKLD
jgi:hypothetical protein